MVEVVEALKETVSKSLAGFSRGDGGFIALTLGFRSRGPLTDGVTRRTEADGAVSRWDGPALLHVALG